MSEFDQRAMIAELRDEARAAKCIESADLLRRAANELERLLTWCEDRKEPLVAEEQRRAGILDGATQPRRIRRGMKHKNIPLSTDGSADEVGELLDLWRDLAGRPRWRRARAAIGRLLTTRTEDL